MLSDHGILQAIRGKQIDISPDYPGMIQPASVDLRLSRDFLYLSNKHRDTCIDPAMEQQLFEHTHLYPDTPVPVPFVLHPGEFVLASTIESITLGLGHAAKVEGKSSLGRLGLMVHSTAGFVDPGFSGDITLELSNVANLPIKLYPGMKIAQICFFALDTPAMDSYGSTTYSSRYQGQKGPTPSKAWKNFKTWPVV